MPEGDPFGFKAEAAAKEVQNLGGEVGSSVVTEVVGGNPFGLKTTTEQANNVEPVITEFAVKKRDPFGIKAAAKEAAQAELPAVIEIPQIEDLSGFIADVLQSGDVSKLEQIPHNQWSQITTNNFEPLKALLDKYPDVLQKYSGPLGALGFRAFDAATRS
jgi:hypothetical protein